MKKILTLAVVISALYSISSYAGSTDPDKAFGQIYFDRSVLAGGFDLSTTFVATLQADDKADGDKYIFTTVAYVKETDDGLNVKYVCKSSNIECDIHRDCPLFISFNASREILSFLRIKEIRLICSDGESALDVDKMAIVPAKNIP
jgi:hypothetical protein